MRMERGVRLIKMCKVCIQGCVCPLCMCVCMCMYVCAYTRLADNCSEHLSCFPVLRHLLFAVCYRGKEEQGAHRNVTAERVSVILQHMLNIKAPSASLMCSQSSWDQQLKRPSAARKTLSWP